MIEGLKEWIINITVAVFFTTAVEMILPDNNMKKYAKFVLGLLLIVVIITPLIKLFDKSFDFYAYSNNAVSYMDSNTKTVDLKKYKDMNIKNTSENFKRNLEKECIINLEEAYPENKYNADIEITYDDKSGVFNINKMGIEVIDKGIKKVKKIDISTKSVTAIKGDILKGQQGEKIKKKLSDKFQISSDIITVYKLSS